MRKFVLSAAVIGGLAACTDAPSAPVLLAPAAPLHASAAQAAGTPIPGQYIVQFRPSSIAPLTNAKYVESRMGGAIMHVYTKALNGAAMHLADDAAVALRSDPRVLSVDQDQTVTISTTQTNPPSWGLDRIDQRNRPLSASYTYGPTGLGVTAYILDTGLNFAQSDFTGRAFAGIDEITPGGTATDCNGHGTHTAGTVGSATYGVAKQVRIVAVRVLDCAGSGSFAAVIAGVDWVTNNATRPAVASMSLGGSFYAPLNTAVENSIAAGIPYAVAAGNSGGNACNESPSSAPNAMVVGATNINDVWASFSNFGTCVKINAPGVGIKSLWIGADGTTNTISGTSMATPHVAGAAALYLQTNPTATSAQVLAALTSNATASVITGVPANTPNLLLYMGFLNNPPVANFTSTCTALSCSFDASTTTALPNATYSWNFGDATTGTGKTVTHVYGASGTYTVTLSVTDANGTSTKTSSVSVSGGGSNQAPVARYTITCPSLQCTADGSSSTDDVGIVSYAWNWGDGRSETHVRATATNTWAAPGIYTVTLTVTDGGGLTNSVAKQVTIPTAPANQSPSASISSPAPNTSVVQGSSVTFTGAGTDPEDGALSGASLVWTSSRDGQIGTGTTFSKSNLSVGQHTITLTATDSKGATGTATVTITITAPNQPPTATITAPANNGSFAQGSPVSFAGSGQDPEDGALAGSSLVWTSSRDGQIGTGTSFSTSTLSVGQHTITLTATDSKGATGTATRTITITAGNQPPVARFTFNCNTGVQHQCTFDGSSSTDDAGIVSYNWTWGDGRSETHVRATATNTWVTGGVFNVTLTVTDGGGLTNSTTIAVTVP